MGVGRGLLGRPRRGLGLVSVRRDSGRGAGGEVVGRRWADVLRVRSAKHPTNEVEAYTLLLPDRKLICERTCQHSY